MWLINLKVRQNWALKTLNTMGQSSELRNSEEYLVQYILALHGDYYFSIQACFSMFEIDCWNLASWVVGLDQQTLNPSTFFDSFLY